MSLINELNNIYENWKVISLSDKIGSSRERYWFCKCQNCGDIIEIKGIDLRKNNLPQCKKCYLLKQNYQIKNCSEKELQEIKKIFPPYSGKIGGRFIDRSGTKIGHLELLYRGENDPTATRPRAQYVCKCDCGNIVKQRGENILQSGDTASCGHCKEFQFNQLTELKNFYILNSYKSENDENRWHITIQCKQCNGIFSPRRTDLYNNFDYECPKCNASKNLHIGSLIGQLTIIDKKVDNENHLKYLCQCNCGTTLWLSGLELQSRRTCGNHNDPNDIIGQKFGKLLVIKATEEYRGGNRQYKCKCDCGTEKLVSRGNLLSGHTTSCGCTLSKGEEKIASILKSNNIIFEKGKTFPDLYQNNKCGKLKIDFFLPQYNCAIEFDGWQHFGYDGLGWNTEENYQLTHQRDLFKNQYCFNNNITLIRIPYWYLNNLNIQDLLPETSAYILTKNNELEYYN